MSFTLERLEAVLTELTKQFEFCVAYSGGLDSHVLLHALTALVKQHPNWRVRALHIHHGLQAHADNFVLHCQRVARDLNIPIQIEKLNLTIKPGDSVEAVARQARYQMLYQALSDFENLLTAHTGDDQVETFLLQLMRGAGVKGLSAMPVKKISGSHVLLRPLLNFSRQDLLHYATAHQLSWIEDQTNNALRFNRNYLRHEVMPILKQRWPSLLTTVSRAAMHCHDASTLLDELADDILRIPSETLSIDLLLPLSPAAQRNVLRRWIERLGYPLPTREQIEQIRHTVIAANEKAIPLVHWAGADLRRYRRQLYLMQPLAEHDPHEILKWDLQQELVLPKDLGRLQVTPTFGKGLSPIIDVSQLTVRFRQGGERIRLHRGQRKELKHLMQAFAIPPWQRSRVPLIFLGEELIAIVGYAVSVDYEATSEETGWSITLV